MKTRRATRRQGPSPDDDDDERERKERVMVSATPRAEKGPTLG
jgi:hypothetical protein